MKRVLIVDDNPDNRYLLRMLLQGNGYAVEEAQHGVEALAAARRDPPDFVISDLLMPEMDGYTLLRNWRTDERLKTIPFIVYTATYTEPRDERLALDLGADAFVIKPAEPEAFMACVDAVLAKAIRGELPPASGRQPEDPRLLEEYNEVLVRKLEKKVLQLERANRELLEEIAERKHAERALQLRDRAIQAVSQGIVITDPNQPDNPVVYVNSGFERMTGYRLEEVIGKNCRFLQGKDTDSGPVAKLHDAIEAGHACAVEILNYRKDGGTFWNDLSLAPVQDASGALSYFVGVLSDVTDRKKLEDQLRQSQKMEAIGRLAGGVAHDFNNLLTIIFGYSHALLTLPEVSDTVRASVKAISDAGERAAVLTRQLLGFSRQTMLQPRILDLNDVIAETAKMLRRLIGEDILFTTALDPQLAQIKVDPGQLDQVLMNLAVNARDAMPRGGHLTIETANVVLGGEHAATDLDCQPGPHVMLAISDTGCGMTADVASRVFEPFFTTKEVGKGTGLGLAVVLGIVQQSGGCIRVYSEPGQGTTFKIYFPAVAGHVAGASVPANGIGEPGTETILLVEDEEAVRELALLILEMNGYTVLTATDGKDALQIVESCQEPLDLVLTDVVMPNMSGPELARELKARFPRIKVLYTSGYTADAVVRHGLLAAEVSFLQKPYTPLRLTGKVRQVLDEKNADR